MCPRCGCALSLISQLQKHHLKGATQRPQDHDEDLSYPTFPAGTLGNKALKFRGKKFSNYANRSKQEYMHLTGVRLYHTGGPVSQSFMIRKSLCGGHKAKHWSGLGACCIVHESLILVQLVAPLMVWVWLTKLSNCFQQCLLIQTSLISYGTMHQTVWRRFDLFENT